MKKILNKIYLVLFIIGIFIALFFFSEISAWLFSESQTTKIDRGIAKFTFDLRGMQKTYRNDPFTGEPTCEVWGQLVVENYSPKTLNFDLVLAKFYAGDKIVCISKQYMSSNNLVYTHYVLPSDTLLLVLPDFNYSSQQDFVLEPNIQLIFNIASIYNYGAYSDKVVEVSLYKKGAELITRKFKYKEVTNPNLERSI